MIAKALAKIPTDRYATCPEFASALRRACGLDSSGTDPGHPAAFPDPPPREATPREDTRMVPGVPAAPGLAAAGDTPAEDDPDPATGQRRADLPAGGTGPATQVAGPASSESSPPESPPHGTQPGESPPGESPPGQSPPGEPARREPAPWESLYRKPPPREPRPRDTDPRPAAAAAGPPVPPDATQDVPLVGPGPPARPPGPTPGFSRRTSPPPPAPAPRRRGPWALLALAAVVILGVVVVFVAKPFSSGDKTVGSSQALPPLAVPGCTTQSAHASQLSHVTSRMVSTSGHPFDVAVTPGFAFVSGAGSGLSVMNTQKSVPAGMWDSAPLDHAQGEALTPDGHYLVVTGGSGITVFRVSDLEQRAGATAIGSLVSPGQTHAEDVAITPDGHFAFVTFQNSASVGVFNLQRALSSGFGSGAVVGLIPVGPQPIGIAIPPDGQHAYVASDTSTPGAGVLSVIDVRQAEKHPGTSSVIKKVPAGCKPNRIAFSAGGQNLWVTATGSNALLGFSTAKLLSDPGHALLARVPVGQSPLGLAVISNGTRIVVADSNKVTQPGSMPNLAVVSVSEALARKARPCSATSSPACSPGNSRLPAARCSSRTANRLRSRPCRWGPCPDAPIRLAVMLTEPSRGTRVLATPDGRQLQVLDAGPAGGLPLVFHNGTPGGLVAFPAMVAEAAARGLRTVMYARPGYGDSTGQPGRRVADAAADVTTVLDGLGAGQFVTVGWSGGGPHALACAAMLPGRCLAAASLAGVAPAQAGGLDWVAGMGPENVTEFTAASQGEAALTAFLEEAAAGLGQVTGPQVAEELGGLIAAADQAVVTAEFADYLAGSFRAALHGGIAGWRDDDIAFLSDWGFPVDRRRRPDRHLARRRGPDGPVQPRRLARRAHPGGAGPPGSGRGPSDPRRALVRRCPGRPARPRGPAAVRRRSRSLTRPPDRPAADQECSASPLHTLSTALRGP